VTIALLAILAYGLGTMWVAGRWAWGAEQIAIFAVAIAWWIGYAAGALRMRRAWSALPLAGAASIGALQLALHTTVDRWATEEQVLTWLTWLAAHLVACKIMNDDTASARFFRWTGYLAIAIAVLAILHRTTSHGKVWWWFETGRSVVMGVFPYDNQYAAFVLVTLPGVLLEGLAGRRNRVAWMLGAAVLVGSVISSASVAGAVLTLAETLVVIVWMARRGGLPRGALVTAAALLLAATAIGAVGGWKDMLSDLERKKPLESRRLLTLATIDMAREKPAGGWGLGTWTEVYPAYARFDDGAYDNAAHNDWAQWAAEGGVPLVALLLLFAAMVARAAWRSPLALGLLFALAYDLIEFHFQERPAFGCFFFAYAGAVFAAVENFRTESRARIS
jgi:O-antigen ligase